MKHKEMINQLVFGYSGTTNDVPCIYKDRGHYPGTRTDEVEYRAVEEICLFTNLSWDTKINVGECYAYRTQSGYTGLYEITEEEILRLFAMDTSIHKRKQALEQVRIAEKSAEEAYHQQIVDNACTSIKNMVCVERKLIFDEGGSSTMYTYIVICQDGEQLRFNDRNVFDFGRVINPCYSIVPGLTPGGLVIKENGVWLWQTFIEDKGWKTVRPLTKNEIVAYNAVMVLGGNAKSFIRI